MLCNLTLQGWLRQIRCCRGSQCSVIFLMSIMLHRRCWGGGGGGGGLPLDVREGDVPPPVRSVKIFTSTMH